MPTLQNITCRLMWPEGTQFKEVATTYGDGIVETYIPIPSDRPQKFYIHVRSRGYIYEGLAVVVFIDGVYQCNRNRVNLLRPKNGKPVYAPEPIKRGPRKGQQINLSEVEWNIRQEEKPLDRRTHFLGSDWRFDDFKKVDDNTAPDSTEENFQGLGTIDVIILRCAPNPKDKVSPTDYDSGAESDVLNNHLIEEDAAMGDLPKAAGKEKKDGSKDKKKEAHGSDDEEKAKQPEKGKQKGGKNGKEGGDKGKNGGKGDGGDNSGNGKGGGGGGKRNPGQAGKGDKSKQGNQDKKQAAEKPKAAEEDDDNDDEPATIAGFDGPADEYYRGSQYYSDPGWPGYAQANHYGYPNPAGSAHRPPPHHPQGKHVHWDMGPGQPRPPEPRHHDYYAGAYAQTHPAPGYATQSGYGQYPSYDYSHGQTHFQHPPPYDQPHGVIDPYQSHEGQHYPLPGYPRNPPHYPAPPKHAAAHAPAPASARYPPQVGYQHWPQYNAGAAGNTSQPMKPPAQEAQSNIEEAGGWKYVAPKRKTEPPPTITNFNGWQFDTNKGTWVPATGQPSDQKKDQAGGDSAAKDGCINTTNNNQSSDWTTGTTKDKSDEWTTGTTNDTQNDEKKDDSWGDGKDSDKNDTSGDKEKDDDWGGSKNDDTDWGKDHGNTQGGTSDSNDAVWGDTTNTQSNGAGESKSTPSDDVPRADRTLHGPLGAYFGPKIAVEQDPDVPWIADEPPAYDLPNFIVNKLGISKQVQRGKGYNHVKKHRKPIYIDSIAEPYARFVFKYRTRDKLPRGFDKLEGLEPTPDHVIQQLQEKKKEDLIAELQRWRLAYGDKAPEPKIDLRPQKDPDHAAWNLDLPKRDYLNYQLPGQFPDEAPAKADNSSQNNTPQANNSCDSTTNDNAQTSNQAWDGCNTATTDSGNAGWDSGNTGGGGNVPKSGW